MTHPSPSPDLETRPPARGLPWGAILGVAVLTLAGFAMLAYAIYSLTGEEAPAPTQTVSAPTRIVVVIPTTTPVLATATPPIPPTATATPTENALASTSTPTGAILTITLPANVRSGPGQNYPVIGGLQAGETAPVIGRDAAGTWFVISFSGSLSGQGWVSNLVSSYAGDVNSLPVVAVPPPPPTAQPTAPPANTAAPTAPPPPVSAHGLTGSLTLCSSRTTYAVNERICFREQIKNTTNNVVRYGILGVLATPISGGQSQFQTSWGGDLAIDPGCFGPTDRCGGAWEDGMKLGAPGTYRLTLNICYSSRDTCLSGGEWETLTGGLVVTVQ
jgi:hypothetical protein